MKVDLLIHAKWLIPVEPKNTIYTDYSIAIKDGIISAIGSTVDIRGKYKATKEHNLNNHAIIPGLINAHTHAAMNLFNNFTDDDSLINPCNKKILYDKNKLIEPECIINGSELAIAKMLRCGTTCFNDMCLFPNHTADVCANFGMRVVVGLILVNYPTLWAKDIDEYIVKGEKVRDDYKHSHLIKTAFAPYSPNMFSDDTLSRIHVLSEELDIPIHMHLHESESEIKKSIEKYGKRPLQRLSELNLLNLHMLAVNMTQLEMHEIKQLANFGVSVINCPQYNIKFTNGFCPVDDLIKAGVNVCIGTDNATNNNDLDITSEMRMTAIIKTATAKDNNILDAHETLRLGTINGAKALGMDDIIGSLKIGKHADIVAIDLKQIETMPLHNPLSQIIYSADRKQVTDVWVFGRHLLDKRKLTTINYEQLIEKTKKWETETNNY